MANRIEIQTAVMRSLDLPPLPQSALFIQHLLENPSTTAKDLATVISSDSTLTSLLLRQANSPQYGFPNRINSVTMAIVALGFDAIREIAMSVSIISIAGTGFQSKHIDSSRYWSHSLATALSSKIIAEKWSIESPGESFVAGLLHDIGKLILASFWPDETRCIISRMIRDHCPVQEAESAVVGTDHAEIAGWLMSRWNLPENLITAVTSHHKPADALDSAQTRCLRLANCTVQRMGYKVDNQQPNAQFEESDLTFFAGFDERVFHSKIRAIYRHAITLLDLLHENIHQS